MREATRNGPAPPQPRSRLADVMGETPLETGEDCLTLTIWTPAVDAKKRPVLVWLHGGAFSSGAGSLDCYSGARLAERGDLVVVGVNYRLGVLGYSVRSRHQRRQSRAARSAGRAALGARQHRRVRRRSVGRDVVRSIRRCDVGADAHDDAGSGRLVLARDLAEPRDDAHDAQSRGCGGDRRAIRRKVRRERSRGDASGSGCGPHARPRRAERRARAVRRCRAALCAGDRRHDHSARPADLAARAARAERRDSDGHDARRVGRLLRDRSAHHQRDAGTGRRRVRARVRRSCRSGGEPPIAAGARVPIRSRC